MFGASLFKVAGSSLDSSFAGCSLEGYGDP